MSDYINNEEGRADGTGAPAGALPVSKALSAWTASTAIRSTSAIAWLTLRHSSPTNASANRPVSVPVLSGTHRTFVLIRAPWAADSFAGAVDPGFLPYLEDGDPLMALLV